MPRLRFKRLSTQIYLTILVALLAVVLTAGVMWRRANEALPVRQAFEVAGELAMVALPPPTAPKDEIEAVVRRFAQRLDLVLGLYDADRRPIASSGGPVPPPPAHREESGFVFGRGGPAWAVALPDGRWLVARTPRKRPRHPGLWFIGFLGAIAAAVGLTAWPVARGVTRRLERLQSGVERLGVGDLSARVEVKGNDEVARLARSFNSSAERIEALVASHRLMLANASHELRTPLARLRMGIELMKGAADPERKATLERDIAELDQLIDEILLSSRLDAGSPLDRVEPVDLLALAAEEAAHYADVHVSGAPAIVNGDVRLMRRLIRNLIENGRRHGRPPIEIVVASDPAKAAARISVTDRGDGFAPGDVARAFEPFQRGTQRGSAAGSGLGLALVRQIAERHKGTATVAPGDDGVTLNRIVVTLAKA